MVEEVCLGVAGWDLELVVARPLSGKVRVGCLLRPSVSDARGFDEFRDHLVLAGCLDRVDGGVHGLGGRLCFGRLLRAVALTSPRVVVGL